MRKYLPYIAAIIIGLAVFGITFLNFEQRAMGEINMVSYPVPIRKINAHETITPNILKTKQFPAENKFVGAVTDMDSIVGKIATETLYEEWPINHDSVSDIKDFENKQVVTISVSYARTGGARPGDMVDVYLVNPEQSAWYPGGGTLLVANNARVLTLTDQQGRLHGKNSNESFGIPNVAKDSEKIEVAKLMVNPSEVPHIIPGAIDGNYILVVKYKETGGAARNVQDVWEETNKEEPDDTELEGNSE